MLSSPAALPPRVARLSELANDLWWTWHRARDVFRRLDYGLWRECRHNPVLMLTRVGPETWARALSDPGFLALYDESIDALDATRRSTRSWWQAHVGTPPDAVIAYFCAEFALHQSLPIYAGGLGVLAGDHCKEASDLGVPLVGVGFMYPQGYFRQRITADGWQIEQYQQLDWQTAPVTEALTASGAPCEVVVPLENRAVVAKVWQVQLGRVRLLLLDTEHAGNVAEDRALSLRLYGGDAWTRLQQEIVLGLGGVLALRALGYTPAAWHLNEGHAAFVILQRVRDFLAAGRSWDEALHEVRRTTIFTTHTPVPAGHDAFPMDLVTRALSSCWGSLDGEGERFLALGRHDAGAGPLFNMTALAMRSAGAVNAVSELHGAVTRAMFAPLWQEPHAPEQPVGVVTNGVHVPSWVARELSQLFEQHLSPAWREQYEDPVFWQRILDIADEDLWAARSALRAYLFQFIRERARERWIEQATAAQPVVAGALLNPEALTIGFGRRFTSYKRPELIFQDPARLERIVGAAGRPVQLVFAGKAHPADEAGKHHLQHIFQHALDPRFAGRIAFVDDYDLHVARRLVQGCDVWLNTPRKPLEASGTSGMKASINGVLHLSIGDGWWAEGFTGGNGWQIAGTASPTDPDATDAADAEALYTLLEREVVPAFYDRDLRGVPRRWIAMVKQAILTITPRFSTRRMLRDYVARAYAPAITRRLSGADPL